MARDALGRAAAGVLLAVILGGYYALRRPYLQRADHPQHTGSRPPDRTEGDVLLLLPDVPAAQAQSFDELDCSYGWFNALWQEYGSFASAMTRNLSPEILAGRSVVVIPARVAEGMPAAGVRALAHFVRQGGQLILERPGEGWEELVGSAAPSAQRPAQRITATEGLEVHGPMREHLPGVPLVGQLGVGPRQEAWPAGPTLLEIDGSPGLLLHELGEGRVYTARFELGCTLTAIQQGLPTEGMSFVAPREEQHGELSPTSIRVADGRLRQARVPYADLLERALWHHVSRHRPVPRLWMFPGTKAGALVVNHPALENTRAALGYADWSRKQEGTSTIFAPPDRLNAAQLGLLEQTRADLGLLWVRGAKRGPVVRALGVGALQPLAQELELGEQVEALEQLRKGTGAASEGSSLALARAEGGLWARDWSTTFEQMAHAKIRLDHSFGPHRADEHGYLFGTGGPFYPLDERGLPLPLLELPYLFHERSLTREQLRQALVNSQAYFHQSVAISVPASTMRQAPSAGALMGLRDAHPLAREHDHWIATARELLEFLYARRRSVLTSQWSAKTRRLTISVNLLGVASRTRPEGAFPGVAFPRTWGGEEIERVVVDGEPVARRELVTTGPSFEQILELGPGRHTLSVYYAAPREAESPDESDP